MSLRAESGVSVAGFTMTAFPPASAGPTLWQTRFSGKLNGLIATTTPQGTRSVKASLPAPPGAPSTGIVSPWIRLASSAEPRMVSMARLASSRPSAIALPSSTLIVRPRSSWRAAIRSAALRRIRKRSYPDRRAIALAPRTALSSARSTSPRSARGTVSMTERS